MKKNLCAERNRPQHRRALQKATKSERKFQMKTVKKYNKDKVRVRKLMQFVEEKGGIQHAENVMRTYQQKALEFLNDFEPSIYKDAMESLIHFVIDRKK